MPSNKPVPGHVKSAILHYAQNTICTQKHIAELTGVSERSVYRVLKQHGELKHMPRMTKEIFQVFQVIKNSGVNTAEIPLALERFKNGPTRGQIVKAIVDMDEATWGAILKEIVTGRVAKNSNNMVATAMLNIMNAVDKNAKPGNN